MKDGVFNLRRLALVGGGRWARVLISVLHEILPPDARILVVTLGNGAAMRKWSTERYPDRIEVGDFLPDARGEFDAVIVANAARGHAEAALRALGAGIPALVEKPLALTEADAREIVELAERNRVPLATSRVPLFARYVERFRDIVANSGKIENVRFSWTDSKDEVRYGETKTYDSAVTLFEDLLPHMLPILRRLVGGPIALGGVTLSGGGRLAELQLTAGDIPCTLSLGRDTAARTRIVRVQSSNDSVLDFSEEPGRIVAGDKTCDGDPDWNSRPRPLATMLRCFLEGLAEGRIDERLSADSAIADCRIADEMRSIYRRQQTEWLAARLGQSVDEEIRYALAEILASSDGKLPPDDRTIERLWAAMTASGASAVRNMLAAADRAARIKSLVADIA
jgi:predicted dehydrogenase